MARLRPASWVAAIAALLWAGRIHAQAPEAGPTSGAPPAQAQFPALVHVVAIPCGSGLLDVSAFASALRVELMQQGVRAVDIVRPDTSPSDVPATIVELRAAPCDSSARALTFAIRELAPTAPGRTGTVDLSDVDFASRARVAALAIAEAFVPGKAEADAVPRLTPGATASGEAPEDTGPSVTPSIERNSTAPSALPSAPAASATALPGFGPAPLAPTSNRSVLTATLDARVFTAYATGLLGPRADLAASSSATGRLRLHLDAGAAFGSAHDPLGSIELALLSGAASLTLLGHAGAISMEIGPRMKVGWIDARGSPISPGTRGGQLDGTFIAASLLAVLGIQWSARWEGIFSVDVGDAFAGLEVRSDSRPAAGTIGPMLAARIGFSYGL